MSSSVLFICTGNLCRSPIAEVVARHMYESTGLHFGSAGLTPVPGHGASQGSEDFVAELGLSLDGHQSRGLTGEELARTSWVIGMTRSHAAIFKSRYRAAYQGAIGVLGAPGVDLAQLSASPVAEEVDDPYGMSLETYQATGRQIQRLLKSWGPVFQKLSETELDDDRRHRQ
jgi:protein-tyrosine-phosphatase